MSNTQLDEYLRGFEDLHLPEKLPAQSTYTHRLKEVCVKILVFFLFGVVHDVRCWLHLLIVCLSHSPILQSSFLVFMHNINEFNLSTSLQTVRLLCLLLLSRLFFSYRDNAILKLFFLLTILPFFVAGMVSLGFVMVALSMRKLSMHMRCVLRALHVAQSSNLCDTLTVDSLRFSLDENCDVVFTIPLKKIKHRMAKQLWKLAKLGRSQVCRLDQEVITCQSLKHYYQSYVEDVPLELLRMIQKSADECDNAFSAAKSAVQFVSLFLALVTTQSRILLLIAELHELVLIDAPLKDCEFEESGCEAMSTQLNDQRLLCLALRDAVNVMRSDYLCLQQKQCQISNDLRRAWKNALVGEDTLVTDHSDLRDILERISRHRTLFENISQKLTALSESTAPFEHCETRGVFVDNREPQKIQVSPEPGSSFSTEFICDSENNDTKTVSHDISLMTRNFVDVFVGTVSNVEKVSESARRTFRDQNISYQLMDELKHSQQLQKRLYREAILHKLDDENSTIELSTPISLAEALHHVEDSCPQHQELVVTDVLLSAPVHNELAHILRSRKLSEESMACENIDDTVFN